MKLPSLFIMLFVSVSGFTQTVFNPKQWEGDWKGELLWYRTGKDVPQKVPMEIKIHSVDNKDSWTWQIIYGEKGEDNRPYFLKQADSAGIHWVIDEDNGIVLDQYWVAGKFSGAFSVMNSTIINSYWIEGDKLNVEFYTVSSNPVNTSGKGTDDSPKVDSYRMMGYQKATLKRVQ